MARYIDADLLIEGIDRVLRGKRKGSPVYTVFSAMIGLVDAVPTADVAEVVRCRDCRLGEIVEMPCGAKYIECRAHESYVEENDFCSYGERKEEKGEGVSDDPTE